MRIRRLLLAVLFAALVVAHPGVRAGADEGDDDPPPEVPMPEDIPTSGPPLEEEPLPEDPPSEFPPEESPKIAQMCDGIASLAKLDCRLLFIRKDVALGSTFEAACAAHAPEAVVDGRLECVLGVTGIDDDLITACALSDLEVVDTYSAYGWNVVTVRCLSISDLEPLAASDEVLVIHPQSRGHTNATVSGGDGAMQANNARAQFGLTGNGVRVGVISRSVWRQRPPGQGNDGYLLLGLTGDIVTGTTDQQNGELPDPVNVLRGQAGNTDPNAPLEGTAMLEIVHDVAPGAALSFATGLTSMTDFVKNIRGLAADPAGPCDIIVDDLTYFEEPVYQDGPIALAIADVVSQGVAYFTSAGNFGNTAHEAFYTDVNPSALENAQPPTGVDLHDFGAAKGLASQQFLEINGAGTIVLKWDEPYAGGGYGWGSGVDLDLYVLNAPVMAPGNIVAQATTIQGGNPRLAGRGGDPYETIAFNPSSVAPAKQNPLGNYYVCIDHVGGRTSGLRLHLLMDGPGPTANSAPLMGDRTIFGHAASASACTVAATHWLEVAPPHNVLNPLGSPAGAFNVESFSSVGDANGPLVYLGRPPMRRPTMRFRQKPDVCGPDGVQTTVPGYANFSGTSAAAPHVAAVAALLMEQRSYADWGPELYATLASTAVDMETPGWDKLSGAGFVDALAATQATTIVKVPLQFPTIQAGINAATTAGTYVVVSPGTYPENINFGGRNIRLTSTDPRKPSIVDSTRIDGRNLSSVVSFSGSESQFCLLTGFRIQHGRALSVDGAGISGNRCYATIRRNVIRDNKSINRGGGLGNCDGTIRRNTITLNSADLEGGGLSSCSGTVEDNVIEANDAGWLGGGLAYCYGFVHRNNIRENTAQINGGGLSRCGGSIQDNEICDNTAKYSGGGLDDCDGLIADNRIRDNQSTRSDGGGLRGCDGTIARNVILNNRSRNGANTTGGNGGGLAFCQGRVHNNVIARNKTRSNKNGGGLYQCNGDIQFNTISGNTAAAGDGMHSCGIAPSPSVPWLMANCIVWGNGTGTQMVNCGAFTYCDVQNLVGSGTGNISADPLFVNALVDDYSLTSLKPTPQLPQGLYSPCIDKGRMLAANPSSLWCDVTPFLRPAFGYGFAWPDMGAVEHR